MQISDIEGLLRSHLVEGESMVEEASDYFDDRMYTITTAAQTVHAYTIRESGLYGIGTEGALEVWRADDGTADRAVAAVLDYARRNGQPLPPPDPEKVFADAIAYLRPLLQEGETLSTSTGRNGEPFLHISGHAGGSSIWDGGGQFCRTDPLECGHILGAAGKDDKEAMLRAALDEARNPIDYDAYYPGNR